MVVESLFAGERHIPENAKTPAIAEVLGGGPPGIRTLNLRIKSPKAPLRNHSLTFDFVQKSYKFDANLSACVWPSPAALVVDVVVTGQALWSALQGDKGAKGAKGAKATPDYHLASVTPYCSFSLDAYASIGYDGVQAVGFHPTVKFQASATTRTKRGSAARIAGRSFRNSKVPHGVDPEPLGDVGVGRLILPLSNCLWRLRIFLFVARKEFLVGLLIGAVLVKGFLNGYRG